MSAVVAVARRSSADQRRAAMMDCRICVMTREGMSRSMVPAARGRQTWRFCAQRSRPFRYAAPLSKQHVFQGHVGARGKSVRSASAADWLACELMADKHCRAELGLACGCLDPSGCANFTVPGRALLHIDSV